MQAIMTMIKTSPPLPDKVDLKLALKIHVHVGHDLKPFTNIIIP